MREVLLRVLQSGRGNGIVLADSEAVTASAKLYLEGT